MENFYEILNSFVDSTAIINNQGEIIFTNKGWKQFSIENSGNSKKTDCGTNYLEVCRTVEGAEFKNANDANIGINKVIKREVSIFELEYPCHSDNERRWFILRCTPLQQSNSLSIISHINVTKRKLAEENVEFQNKKIQDINKRLNSTIYKIVHDIQSPLNSLMGLIYLSKEENETQPINQYFSLIESSILNLKDFIQETLKYSISGDSISEIDFKSIVNDFLKSIKYVNDYKQIVIKKEISQQKKFYSYKSEISSVISNLVSNSLKYNNTEKANPFVEIRILVNEKNATIIITDNGIGISDKIISKIFDLNFQVANYKQDGAGVGLHLVKKSIEFLKGAIKVNSKPGHGTEFIIDIPNLK